MERIVIVGGGFAGLHLIRQLRLRAHEATVTLVDRNNYHLFTPLLYQVATGELPPHAVAYPLRHATGPAGIGFLQADVREVDLDARVVRSSAGDLPFTRCVLVPGSVTNDFGIPGVARHARPLKTLADAESIRRSVLSAYERAAVTPRADARRWLLTFVVVGAGPTGVELAASLRDLMTGSLATSYGGIDATSDVRVVVLDAADRVLPQMDRRLASIAEQRLRSLNVEVVLGARAAEIDDAGVRLADGRRYDGGIVVWSAGIRANPLVQALDVPKARDGRLLVDESFRVDGRDDLLSFGDSALVSHDGRGIPQQAQAAVLEARIAARVLAGLVRGKAPIRYRHQEKGDLVALGRTSAAARLPSVFGPVVLDGVVAWTVWRFNYLQQLVGARNKATLLAEWALSFVLHRQVANIP